MTVALAGVLGLAVVVAVGRLLFRWFRAPPDARGHPWRLAILVALQPLCAGLFYLMLSPPPFASSGTLVVATRGADAAAALTGDQIVALPEAPPLSGAERVPDLATALRRHGPTRLRIVGDGLRPRDRDAARGLAIDFAPGPPPRGLVRLDPPPPVAAGAGFRVGGRVSGVAPAQIELIDPAGRRVASATPDAAGDFVVAGSARSPGPAAFTVRVREGTRVVEEATVPVWAEPSAAARILLLSGAPGPEVKYLRRWASDAGLVVHSEVATGAGVELGDAPIPLTATTLGRFDLAVVDVRRWAALNPAERATFGAAVAKGLGLVIRIDGPLSDAARTTLRPLGFVVAGGEATIPVVLPGAADAATRLALSGPGTRDAPAALNRGDAQPPLTRWAIRVAAPAATSLLRDDHGAPLAVWRAAGQGRVALWSLADSFRLVLAGHGDTYGELWSAALATLGRGAERKGPAIAAPARVGQRVALCGVGDAARVTAPDGHVTRLVIDPAAGPRCAGFWPLVAGWHRLAWGGGDGSDRTSAFAVVPSDALPNAAALADRAATIDLAQPAPPAGDARPSPGTPWPWFVAWLGVSAVLWWFERSGRGRPDRVGQERRGTTEAGMAELQPFADAMIGARGRPR